MKLIVCENCEAEFRTKHTMDDHYYSVKFCVFCGENVEEDYINESVWDEDD
jgi:rRNA maturation endonuclease Nob1